MSKDVPMYLRVKRQNQTYFIMCTPTDTFGYIKDQICLATKKEYKTSQMRLMLPSDDAALPDDDTLDKHETIKNESELHVVFQISEGEWESVQVEDTQMALMNEE